MERPGVSTSVFDGKVGGKANVLVLYEKALALGVDVQGVVQVNTGSFASDIYQRVRESVLAELAEDGTEDEVSQAANVLTHPEVQNRARQAADDFRRSTRRSGVTRVVMAVAVEHGAPRRGWQPVYRDGAWRAERSAQAIRAAAQRVRSVVKMRGGL